MPTFLRLIEIRKREHAFEVMAIAISTRFILIFIKEGDAGRKFCVTEVSRQNKSVRYQTILIFIKVKTF